MRQSLFAAAILIALAAPAPADDGVAPVSREAVWFKMAVGEEPANTVLGFVDESKGTGEGYDTAVLDLDGDGHPEAKQEIVRRTNPRTGKPMPNTEVVLERDGKRWVLDLYGVGMRRFLPAERRASYPNYIRWSVTAGDFYAWFINGKVEVYATAKEALAGDAIRLGGPFHFEMSATTRGPDALVNVGLEDANGCTLRLARRDKKQMQPLLSVAKAEEEVFATHAAYG